MPPGRPRKSAAASRRAEEFAFSRKLVLNQWLLGLFRFRDGRSPTSTEELTHRLRTESEGFDEYHTHHFHHALVRRLDAPQANILRVYEENIARHTRQINDHRRKKEKPPIVWKYFQYLSLLFVEIYLDHYFRDPVSMRRAINARITEFNHQNQPDNPITPFDETGDAWTQLNKLALWCATGSGKTLLMHTNILQYQHYRKKYPQRRHSDRTLLLTPNEGLSQQHLEELEIAGLHAEIFKKGGTLFRGNTIEIIDIFKLADASGDKTVAVDEFMSDNLVLVDEGHRGASSGRQGKWMAYRNRLCEKGFSFEYSATFSQAIGKDKDLADDYAKTILFDYPYRCFHNSGFGKNYHILNIDWQHPHKHEPDHHSESRQQHADQYLVACLLVFFQQQWFFQQQKNELRPFNIEKPLWVFVGGKVTPTKQNVSDILEILLFLARYLARREESVRHIAHVLKEGMLSSSGKDFFAGRFGYLESSGMTEASLVYGKTLEILFNAPGGGTLFIENLKGAAGEIALRVGNNPPFGVIDVGDDTGLVKLCAQKQLQTSERVFSGSLFHEINQPSTQVNLLIGAKKFMEGWNSWRVSTMGLMNVGKEDGTQIIQLFGRGVRLKGYDHCLIRSNCFDKLPENMLRPEIPKHLDILETLAIFGIHANYMAQFRDYLKEEGLSVEEDIQTVEIPVVPMIPAIREKKLKIIGLKKTIHGKVTRGNTAFCQLAAMPAIVPDLEGPARIDGFHKVELNWYPKINAILDDGDLKRNDADNDLNEGVLSTKHVAFLDIDRLYFDLQELKANKGWHNLNLTRRGIENLLAKSDWYTLKIPSSALKFDSFDKVAIWQEIALALLTKHITRYYDTYQKSWEDRHSEYQELTEDHPNFLKDVYLVHLIQPDDVLKSRLEEFKKSIKSGQERFDSGPRNSSGKEPPSIDYHGLETLWCDNHLFGPLLCLKDQEKVQITPDHLNQGECLFVNDLRRFHQHFPDFFRGREVYLLRNQSRGRGVGFHLGEGSFYPDFILWILVNGKQHIAFIDPKGLRQMGEGDAKLTFHERIKDTELRLADPNVVLHAFIIAPNDEKEMKYLRGKNKIQLKAEHILLQKEDGYVGDLLTMILPP